MDKLLILVVIALVTEAVWETLKMTWQNGKFSIDRIGALVVGLIVACATNVDILELVGVPVVFPYVGVILTGILISRGSNFVHDLYEKISNPKEVVSEVNKEINRSDL
ncbi:MAG: hypothetical protein RR620_14170 [Clostridium sp.]